MKSRIKIPDYYKRIKPSRLGKTNEVNLPKDAEIYGFDINNTSATVVCFPVTETASMPFDDNKAIVAEYYEHMDGNIELIRVDNGKTESGKRYVYSIRKMQDSEQRLFTETIIYLLNLNVETETGILFYQGSFEENGFRGERDATIFELFARNGGNEAEWLFDPCGQSKKGILMNRSEEETYDAMFPDHPLSRIRELILFIKENV